MFQKILATLDKSEISKHVFEEALELAKSNSASLMLLHVLSVVDEDDSFIAEHTSLNSDLEVNSAAIDRFYQQWRTHENQGLELLRSHAAEAIVAGINTESIQCFGDRGACICAVARAWSADLIVVGRRRLSVLRELLPGSVSSYVLHHAPCTVMTVQYPVKKDTHTTQLQSAQSPS